MKQLNKLKCNVEYFILFSFTKFFSQEKCKSIKMKNIEITSSESAQTKMLKNKKKYWMISKLSLETKFSLRIKIF